MDFASVVLAVGFLAFGRLSDGPPPWVAKEPRLIYDSASLAIQKDSSFRTYNGNVIAGGCVILNAWGTPERKGMSLGVIPAKDDHLRFGVGIGTGGKRKRGTQIDQAAMNFFLEHKSGFGLAAVLPLSGKGKPEVFYGWRIAILRM